MRDDSRSGSITIRASKRWLGLFAGIILIPWLLFLLLNAPDSVRRVVRRTLLRESDDRRLFPSHKGPWGDLRIVRIVTEPPE